jgi:glycosyltransferase involved in cell wall biosynthesis
MASGLNKNSGETGWAAQVIGKAGVRPPVPGCNDVFSPPPSMSAGRKLLAALGGFKRKLEYDKFIADYSEKLRGYADALASADVIHAHDVPALLALKKSGLGGAAALCFTPGALCRFSRGTEVPEWMADEERAALAAADFILAPSRDYMKMLEGAYGPLKQPYIILPGLEDEKYLRTGALRRKLGVPEPALLAAAFCGSEPEEDTLFFIDSFAAARKQAGEKLFAAAAAEATPALKEKISALGFENSFFLLPPRQEGRGEVLAEADVFFSALKCPPLDMGAIEALRAGLAVVAADDSWNAESAGYGEAAMLFKAGDAASAGRALSDLARHPPALIHFSSKARDYFMAQYTLEAFALRAAAAYADMLPARREQ